MEDFLCPSCQSQIHPQQKFCHTCGYNISQNIITCHKCGLAMPNSALFCAECGEKLQNKSPNWKNVLRFGFIFFIFLLFVSIILKTNIHSKTLDEHVSDQAKTITESLQDLPSEEKITEEKIQSLPYEELEFITLSFSGQTTHKAQLKVKPPTNKVLLIETVQDFLKTKDSKINENDITEIILWEEAENDVQKAKFVSLSPKVNKNYKLEDMEPINETLYVKWLFAQNKTLFFWKK